MTRMFRTIVAAAAVGAMISPISAIAGQKVKTKSNIKNDRVAADNCDGGACDLLIVSWESDASASDKQSLQTSVQGPYQLTRADWTTAKGEAFSECSDTCDSAAKVNVQDISWTKRAQSGPGSVTLRFSGDGAVAADSSACPVVGADVGPIKGATIKGGRNPGGNYTLRDAAIVSCNANGLTISYQGMAMNEKGLPGTKTGVKPAAN